MWLRCLLALAPVCFSRAGEAHRSEVQPYVRLDYDEGMAKAYAALAQAAYCGDSHRQELLDWTCAPCSRSGIRIVPGSLRIITHGELGQVNATFMYISRIQTTNPDEDGCVISIRGSSNIQNWIKDFEIWQTPVPYKGCSGCNVEHGFYSVWNAAQAEVLAHLAKIGCADGSDTNNLYVTGHSLGAAVASIAMFLLEEQGYQVRRSLTFEAPRAGDAAYAQAFGDHFARRIPVFRITHSQDPVVHVPMESLGYRHTITEVFYPGNNASNYKICSGEEDPTCADQYSLLDTLLHPEDHCNTPLVPNGNICDCDLPKQDTVLM